MSVFKGSGVAIITPFDENGVNFEVFGQLHIISIFCILYKVL